MQVSQHLYSALPAVPASVPVLRSQVAAFAIAAGVRGPLLAAVKLAVSEAVTNVVVHAYRGAEQPGEVRVTTRLEDDRIELVVSDDGGGMMPRLHSPGLGVGLPLIANSADGLQIGESERGGTELHMTFALAAED